MKRFTRHEMGKNKKRPNEWVTMTWAHRQKDNMQFSPDGMMVKKKMQLLGIKIMYKREGQKKLQPLIA